jgi:glycosyltransferase involved in cell wall biosynthesis
LRISALVCARNEEARIEACLDALSGCDEIVVVADRCTDRTVSIAQSRGARVVIGSFLYENLRKDVGVAACSGDWVLEVDADELVSPALMDEIRVAVIRTRGDWFLAPIDNYVGGRLVRHGWGGAFGTSKVARLYRRGAKSWKTDRVHPGVRFEGAFAGELGTPIRHDVDDGIADMLDRLNRYTAARAEDLAERGTPGALGDNVFRGVRRFWKCYVRRGGWREGGLGFLIAVMAALYPVLSHLKARELIEARALMARMPEDAANVQILAAAG